MPKPETSAPKNRFWRTTLSSLYIPSVPKVSALSVSPPHPSPAAAAAAARGTGPRDRFKERERERERERELVSMEGWDLEAVVRGCGIPNPSPTSTTEEDPFSFLSPHQLLLQKDVDDEQHLLCFPNALLIQKASMQQELEDLCKPFFSSSVQAHQQPSPPPPPPPPPPRQVPRSKRRPNQQKRVVCQVPAEGLSSDMWAWRKYGQKPIKGSPYPRCSSSKGCLARKQVERSRSDPTTFIITYTAEHNHPIPTHRNSLAGSTRPKHTAGPTQQPSSVAESEPPNKAASPLSLTEELPQPHKQQEGGQGEEDLLVFQNDLVMGEDDVFLDLEELWEATDTYAFDDFAFPSPWLANKAATAAGGS
ncbi:WRKY transcription factor 22-like isoform X2 [Magnolia sinica]|uniref:WRKY transcription factor 22-like isoform X2 n=1 Tax=Magnolia sinica TaxID=86752 RepID=UPI002657D02A|nr:WRKY transcription factor 22-like isoform X2 [Magnolia sinica]